jgi:hypothetical protein
MYRLRGDIESLYQIRLYQLCVFSGAEQPHFPRSEQCEKMPRTTLLPVFTVASDAIPFKGCHEAVKREENLAREIRHKTATITIAATRGHKLRSVFLQTKCCKITI